jgi:F-type H+-transporting ATPase subunit a
MKRISISISFLLTAVFAAPAYASGDLHMWTFLSYINHALQNAFGIHTDMTHIIMFTIVILFLAVSGGIIGAGYRKKLETGDIDPSPKFSFANVIEAAVGMVLSLLDEIVGHGSKKYLTLMASLALVIFFSNVGGLIPGSGMPTTNINTTLALALVVFIMYNYYGMRAHGVLKYLEHFMGPIEGKLKFVMAPIMIPIEIISHLARPMSLSLRLFGNMFGDHTILAVFMVGMGIAWPFIFPMPFLFLGLLVSIVQTLVFIMLTMVYISLATASDH